MINDLESLYIPVGFSVLQSRLAWLGAISAKVTGYRAMKPYDPHLPLIFIHVPKTAGASVRRVVMEWFDAGYLPHYYDERTGTPPERDARFDRHSADAPVCVYGHFNRTRGFGVEHTYPDGRQFITILRDPFEMAVSQYYFIRKAGAGWKDQSRVPTDGLLQHLETVAPNMLNHFPRPVSAENYKDIIEEFFIDIGFTEMLVPSLARIAARLDLPFDPARLEHRNKTERDHQNLAAQELRLMFRERNRLEFDVYDYAMKRFGEPEARAKEN